MTLKEMIANALLDAIRAQSENGEGPFIRQDGNMWFVLDGNFNVESIAEDMLNQLTELPSSWPTHGPSCNAWNGDLVRLTMMMQHTVDKEGGRSGWWCNDPDLKYIEIRVDTRDAGFLISGRDGKSSGPVEPMRIAENIHSWNAKYSGGDE